MTDKQEKILKAALELFASEGFAATSTSKVAKLAGVSEGLIFRHYKNKQGLLEAILMEGEQRIKTMFAEVVMEPDPTTLIRKVLNIKDLMVSTQADFDFWKLQYKIKWEIEVYAENKMEPVQMALSNAFKKLGYKNPDHEAEFLLITLDGMATRLFLQKDFDAESMISLLHEKYKV
jgi:AcrR family transcriptional regulator